MKLMNSTRIPNHVLRRMVVWCCRELKMPSTKIRSARFRNYRWGSSGHCYVETGDICVSTAESAARMDELVAVTAHECAHRRLHIDGSRTRKSRRYGTVRSGGSEKRTMVLENQVLATFKANRDALLAEWNAAVPPKPKPSRQQQNEAKARDALTRWERKLKLAKTKVAAYRKRVRYYDRVAANRE